MIETIYQTLEPGGLIMGSRSSNINDHELKYMKYDHVHQHPIITPIHIQENLFSDQTEESSDSSSRQFTGKRQQVDLFTADAISVIQFQYIQAMINDMSWRYQVSVLYTYDETASGKHCLHPTPYSSISIDKDEVSQYFQECSSGWYWFKPKRWGDSSLR
jgi:hypothetical protein